MLLKFNNMFRPYFLVNCHLMTGSIHGIALKIHTVHCTGLLSALFWLIVIVILTTGLQLDETLQCMDTYSMVSNKLHENLFIF